MSANRRQSVGSEYTIGDGEAEVIRQAIEREVPLTTVQPAACDCSALE